MTLQRLENYRHLQKAVSIETERLMDLYTQCGVQSANLSGMPPTSKKIRDRIGEIVPEIVDEAEELRKQIETWRTEEKEIKKWIRMIPDLQTRLIFQLRWEQGLRWNEIADKLDTGEGKITDYTVRQRAYRYIDASERHGR